MIGRLSSVTSCCDFDRLGQKPFFRRGGRCHGSCDWNDGRSRVQLKVEVNLRTKTRGIGLEGLMQVFDHAGGRDQRVKVCRCRIE